MIEQSSNTYRHQGSSTLYAHYSIIDEYDVEKFPSLALTSPVHMKLSAGQSLYIPKNWWHWVKTPGKSFAVNFWFNNARDVEPFVFNHTLKIDTSVLNKETVDIWNSHKSNKGTAATYKLSFEQFYNSGEDYRYLITLDAYYPGESNSRIKQLLDPYVCFPTEERIQITGNYDFNVWASSGVHDTGLHYDDEDGILAVLEGEKDIILFPPSDTEYLYAYPVTYKWLDKEPLNYQYNIAKKIKPVSGTSSGELLYVTCNGDKRVLSNISKLFDKHYKDSLVWGYKKEGPKYRWEIYSYTLHKPDIKITSWDIYPGTRSIPDVEHYYYKEEDGTPVALPFWGYSKYKTKGELLSESEIFVIDDSESFTLSYDKYMDRLGFGSIKQDFRSIILEKYPCYQICIHNKKPGEIFVQYLGISNDNFLEFLETNDYPTYIQNFVNERSRLDCYNINNEVTIVYDVQSKDIIRSGFYGNL